MKVENFKAGLEIHQQLDGPKLFCSCPSINSSEQPNREIIRKLRAVVGESGSIDSAVAHEISKGKEFTYQANSEDSCLVEFDEEPPHNISEYHLETAIIVSKLLNAKIVDEIQVMRKIVVDGSNVSGFQRTMLVGRNGYIETKKGRVAIPTILLEEEAAQKVSDAKNARTYKLDRLGIALLEISTDASLKDAAHIQEVAKHIGMILRSTERIKRGLGTIRQDVNLSIENGNRVEIKGFQDVRSIPKVVEIEIKRQLDAIKEGKPIEKEVRKAESDFKTTFLRPMPTAARLYPETDALPIRITKELLKKIELPTLLDDKKAELEEKYDISETLALEIIKQKINLEDYLAKIKLPASLIATTIIETPKDIKSRLGIDASELKKEDFIEVLEKVASNEIPKGAITQILADKAQGKPIDYAQFKAVDANEVENAILEIIKEKPGLSMGGYMGLAMAKLKGKADGKQVMEILKKHVK